MLKHQQQYMGSLLGHWPSYNPHIFTRLRSSDPSSPFRLTPATYHPTRSMTIPPPDQDCPQKSAAIKRAAPECLIPEHGGKQLRPSASDSFS